MDLHTSDSPSSSSSSSSDETSRGSLLWLIIILNPLIILSLAIVAGLAVYSLHKNRRGVPEGNKNLYYVIMIGTLLFCVTRIINLGMQIPYGLKPCCVLPSTAFNLTVFNLTRLISALPFYIVLLTMLHKWMVICTRAQDVFKIRSTKIIDVGFAFMCVFVVVSLTCGVVSHTFRSQHFKHIRPIFYSLNIIIFGVLLLCYCITGVRMLYLVSAMKKRVQHMDPHGSLSYAKDAIARKISISLLVYLVCLAVRLGDFAAVAWASSYRTTFMYLKLYPLLNTLPECLPIITSFVRFSYIGGTATGATASENKPLLEPNKPRWSARV